MARTAIRVEQYTKYDAFEYNRKHCSVFLSFWIVLALRPCLRYVTCLQMWFLPLCRFRETSIGVSIFPVPCPQGCKLAPLAHYEELL